MSAFTRRKTNIVSVGNIQIGSAFPVRIQSMTNTHTTQLKESVTQAIQLISNGCELIRFAVQGGKEVEGIKKIKHSLLNNNYNIPLIADIHFNPEVANQAAMIVDKVRINPGNYAKIETMTEKFSRLIAICKKHQTAIRVGVNHGSLSERILQKYGNTPKGIVESCMEFLRICKKLSFLNVIVSVKASNTRVMIKSNRLLVEEMQRENIEYPIHLGVTEAGSGVYGRIKSAIGVGTLLNEGIGDTIRISLTEDPTNEPIFAHKLAKFVKKNPPNKRLKGLTFNYPFSFSSFRKRKIHNSEFFSKKKAPVVILKCDDKDEIKTNGRVQLPDFFFLENLTTNKSLLTENKVITPFRFWSNKPNLFPILSAQEFISTNINEIKSKNIFIETEIDDLNLCFFSKINLHTNVVLIAKITSENPYSLYLEFFHYLYQYHCKAPLILYNKIKAQTLEDFQLKAAVSMGALFVDSLANGIFLDGKLPQTNTEIINTSFEILQAAGVRNTKAEFISCPGCGRTHFDLERISQKVKNSFQHLKHLKIAVMGCIVNGIGEMGDADYGYVGSRVGKINLYKGKKLVARNIPDMQAIEELKNIIVEHNDWQER